MVSSACPGEAQIVIALVPAVGTFALEKIAKGVKTTLQDGQSAVS